MEIPLTLTELASDENFVLTPDNPASVPGLRIGDAAVTVTPLGLYMTFPVEADSLDTIYAFGFAYCDEVPGWQGHFTWDDGSTSGLEAPAPVELEDAVNAFESENGTWFSEWTMGQGTVGDTLTIHFYGQHDELMGDVVFTK